MNCREVNERLASGEELSAEAQAHVRDCPACSQLTGLFTTSAEALSPEQLARLRTLATQALRPARPLPSNAVLASVLMALFVVLALAMAAPLHMSGLHALSSMQMAVYFAVITLGALGCASIVVQEMVPASRRVLRPAVVLSGSGVLIAVCVAALFPSLDTSGFVHWGVSCLRAGLLCAALAAVVLSSFASLGFARSRLAATTAVGFLSGLTGFSVLAMHCALLTTPHVMVWHFGVLLIATAIGASVGLLTNGRRTKSFQQP